MPKTTSSGSYPSKIAGKSHDALGAKPDRLAAQRPNGVASESPKPGKFVAKPVDTSPSTSAATRAAPRGGPAGATTIDAFSELAPSATAPSSPVSVVPSLWPGEAARSVREDSQR